MSKIKGLIRTARAAVVQILAVLDIIEKWLSYIPGSSSDVVPPEIQDMIDELEED